MNVYNLKKIETCYVCGNVDKNISKFIDSVTSKLSNYEKKEHKKEIERQERLKAKAAAAENAIQELGGLFHPNPHNRYDNALRGIKKMKASFDMSYSYDNSVIIVSGNCGIGTKSRKFYEDMFSELDKVLAANNCYILFVRGNNDDPSYFDGKYIDFEHVKTLPDYSVICLRTFNCLCVGGSISIDKEWKMSQEEKFGKKLFWENESPKFDEKLLNEILAEFRISCVVTSTSPTFVFPGTNSYKRSKWFSDDKSILKDFSSERKTIDKVYERIVDSDSKPYVWFYGRFKLAHNDKTNDILFSSLQQYQVVQVNNLIQQFFGIDTTKELGINDHAFDAFFGSDKKMALSHHTHDDFLADPFGDNVVEEEGEAELEDVDEEQPVPNEPQEDDRMAMDWDIELPTVEAVDNGRYFARMDWEAVNVRN